MLKLTVIIALAVYSSAVTASPPAPSDQRPSSCSQGHSCEDGTGSTTATSAQSTSELTSSDDETIQELQHTIKLQAQAIQGLLSTVLKQTQNLAQCTNNVDIVTNAVSVAVSAAIAPLREHNTLSVTNPAPAHCATNDDVRTAVDAAVAPLLKTVSNLTPARCRCDELIAKAGAPLQIGNQTLDKTNQELMNTIQNKTTITPTPMTPGLANCGYDSGYTYRQETGSCYKFHAEWVSWPEARDACVAEGGHLAVINGREEAVILQDMAVHKKFVTYMGYQRDDDGVWRAVTGEEIEALAGYNPWRASWPRSDKRRKYAVMSWDGSLVNDFKDSKRHLFICEKRPQ